MKSSISYKCDFCGEKGFKSLQELKWHRRYKCSENPNRVKPRKSIQTKPTTTYSCSYCKALETDMKFSSQSKLNKHILTEHSNAKQSTLEV